MNLEERLGELGLELPPMPDAVANYIPGVLVGEVLFLSGTIGKIKDTLPFQGKLGAELTVEEGYASARLCTLNHLTMAKAVLGDLDRIVRVVRLVGYVNSAPGFNKAPWVVNGASDLLVELLGEEKGRHARAALNVNELTFDAPVETVLTLQVEP
ncbi:MAG: RidA family protein [Nitrospinaceae bacterium]|jgi:enamine deaminase RidA (YjgF/YER057c/UK114 family)|nr:RidA family protein [Nitrospinaceae bacterium]MBT3435762.1 RidA family protein [Nitrospinaceae bacterium]MBT3819793.1 RidA family protein [Nitrospinaceae bacterium]MBT4093203.1 RidA family protein [Nitrospinaceae bacterium]MBT4430674.1 RidA family protein [Nitrospinaceae bacterium]